MREVDSIPGPRARRFVEWTLRYGKWLWAIALLLAIPAALRTGWMYVHLKSDFEQLLPRDAPSVLALDELRARMPGLQYLGVVVDTSDASHLAAGERLVDDLAARIRTYPPTLVRAVRTGNAEERTFLEKHAALYLDLDDLHAIRARIEARRDYEVAKETGALLDDGEPPPLDFSDIERKYQAKLPTKGSADTDRYSSAKLHLTMLLVEVGGFSTGADKGKELLGRVRADLQALGGPQHYAEGMRVGYSGDIAISVEETSALIADLSLSSLLVIVAVVAAIIAYYRWWRSIVILVLPLLLATVYAFAIASLPPLHVTELNSNTAFLGSIILGNGINFGIVLLARYLEERRKSRAVHESLTIAVWSARKGTMSAALAAGAAYASLAVTQFRGFRQFGYIGGIGMVVSWAAAFLLMPSLTAWLDRGPPPGSRQSSRDSGFVAALTRFVGRHRAIVVAVGLVVTGAAAIEVHQFNMGRLEYDFSKLRRADTWTSGEGYWGRRMDELLGEYLTPTVILTDEVSQARVIAAALKSQIRQGALTGVVSSVRTIDDVLPSGQTEKIDEASRIREDMTPKMWSLASPEKRSQLERFLGSDDLTPVGVDDLPRTFTTALRERDGSLGRAVLVYPEPSKALWQGPPLLGFVRVLRDAAAMVGANDAGRSGRVAGSLPVSADILQSIQRDGPRASATAFAGAVLVVLLIFRMHSSTVFVIGALVAGVLWLGAAAMIFGVKINFANFIAFPITFGIGVDYAVNIVSRYLQNGRRDVLGAVRSTGSAVALCSLTTIIGYSSLLLAENRALFLFGLLAIMGEVACLAVALTFLPAVLLLLQEGPADEAESPKGMSSGRL